eukprot:6182466-Pleurochrysis_carterae.AAC.1
MTKVDSRCRYVSLLTRVDFESLKPPEVGLPAPSLARVVDFVCNFEGLRCRARHLLITDDCPAHRFPFILPRHR